MIKLEHVSKYYNTSNNVALGLHDVSVELEKGEIVAITGESGSGKSTFLNVVGGIDSYEDGEMYYYGEETSYFNNEDLEKYRKDNVGFIFQNYNLVNSYTVLQNVMLPLLLRGYNKLEAKKKAKEIISIVGLEKRSKHKGTHLSGGEAQRVSIARAIASDSHILACDEPTGNLDSKTGKEIMELIQKVSEGRLVLIVTHNFEEVESIVTRKITFHDGEIVEDRKLKEASINNEEIKRIDYSIKKKDCIDISFKNILATPKKTIFTCLVFATVAFLICSLIGLTFFMSNQFTSGFTYYGNSNPNRIVVYNEEGIDYDKVKDEYKNLEVIKSSYFEDEIITIFKDNNGESAVLLFQDINKFDLLYGKKPTKDDEVMLGVKKDNAGMYIDYVGKSISMQSNFRMDNGKIERHISFSKVTGIYEYDTGSDIVSFYINNENTRNMIAYAENIHKEYTSYGLKVGADFINCPVYYDDSVANTIVEIPNDSYAYLNNKPLVLKVRDGYDEKEAVIETEGIEYKISESDTLCIRVGRNFALKHLIDDRQISIYANGTTTEQQIISYVEGLGYKAFVPKKISRGIDFDVIGFRILMVITSFFITLTIVSLFFLSYLVLSRIYASKNRDYAIMRTLGVKKKEMSLIVYFEVGFLCIAISVFVFVVLKVLSSIFYGEFWMIYRSFEFSNSIVYFIAIFLFSLLMGRRFNRKLFKFSVNTTMKKEALDND